MGKIKLRAFGTLLDVPDILVNEFPVEYKLNFVSSTTLGKAAKYIKTAIFIPVPLSEKDFTKIYELAEVVDFKH